MIRGIGVDTVTISEMARLANNLGDGTMERIFTEREMEAADKAYGRDEYLAGRFAAKEAVFKALAHLTEEKTFDLRIVETLTHEDGSPYVNVGGQLVEVLKKAQADTLHISITTEGDYATAFVIAEQGGCHE